MAADDAHRPDGDYGGGQHGDPDRAAELADRVEHRGGPASRLRRDRGEGRCLHRHEDLSHRHAQGQHQQSGPPQACSWSEQREQSDGSSHPDQADGDVPARAQQRIQPARRQLSPAHHAKRLGSRAQPRVERAQPAAVLEYSEIAYGVPRNAIELSTMTPLLDRNSRLPSSRRSTIGSAVRNSTMIVNVSSTAPAAMAASTSGECQPLIGPSETPYIASPRPSPENRNPGRSNRPG